VVSFFIAKPCRNIAFNFLIEKDLGFTTVTTSAVDTTTTNKFMPTVKNAKFELSENKSIVKRSMQIDFAESTVKISYESSNTNSSDTLKLFQSHFSEESIRFRTKHCSTYATKFLELFPDKLIRTTGMFNNPSLTFVHKIRSKRDLVTFESNNDNQREAFASSVIGWLVDPFT
jgi:hypothetical protein